MTGTLINVGTVLAGGTIGSLVGARFPETIRRTLIQAIGLITIVVGLQHVLPAQNLLVVLISVVAGTAVGEILRIEAGVERLGELAQRALTRRQTPASRNPQEPALSPSPSRGFVTASLIFCVGPLTILGSFEDGLTGSYQTLALKATLDGITATVLASTLGWGVLLAALTVLVYQGALTLAAGLLHGVLSRPMIDEMTVVGGLLIVGIGLNILDVTRIRVANMLPALLFAPVVLALWSGRTGI